MSLYNNLNATATRLIDKFGQSYAFTKVTQGAFDPDTGTSAETLTTYNAKAVRDEFNSYERNDSSIQIDDIKMIAEVADYDIDDTLLMDSQNYRVVRVDPIKPGPVVLAYTLQVRK